MGRASLIVILSAAAAPAQDRGPSADIVLGEGPARVGWVHSIGGGKVCFHEQGSGGQLVTLPASLVTSIEYRRRPLAPDTESETLELRSGCRFYGTAAGIDAEGIHFRLRDGGRIVAPLAELAVYRKPDAPEPPAEVVGKRHVVVVTNGDVLVGDVQPTADGALRVAGSITATVRRKLVAAVYGPVCGEGDKPAGRAADIVTMTCGAGLCGRNLTLRDGRVCVEVLAGQVVTVPLAKVAGIALNQQAAGGIASLYRSVLAWGAYADGREEFRWTVDALKALLPPGWTVHEDTGESFGGEFRAKLARCRTLLIPEPENWGSDGRLRLAEQLKPIAAAFCRRGGNIVVCCPDAGSLAFLREAGLLDVWRVGHHDNVDVPFTPAGKRLCGNVGAAFRTENATFFYRVRGGCPAETWAETNDGAVIVARRVGRGWVVLLGMDFFKRSDQVNRILANAVMVR